jgi:hypothetical protein
MMLLLILFLVGLSSFSFDEERQLIDTIVSERLGFKKNGLEVVSLL